MPFILGSYDGAVFYLSGNTITTPNVANVTGKTLVCSSDPILTQDQPGFSLRFRAE